ncbi:LCP family protein [Salsuginibacillus kocurii]|uniref:LCP family glycopolymer transferase n=1 Tax=Salsuginibacillus kocurii TaxID=427078 RepID=UPI000368CE0F|nr:LCP family protein [Salsuginibacillus kocurii]
MNRFKTLLIILGTLLLFLVAGTGAYAVYLYQSAEQAVHTMNESFEEEDETTQELLVDSEEEDTSTEEESNSLTTATEPITFLLAGIGDRPDDPGRADAVMAISVNPLDDSVLMFNIPRDTLVENPETGQMDKLNHTYANGGISLLRETTEHFLDHSFDYVISANMDGFRDIIDTIGDIEVENEFAFSETDEFNDQKYHYDEGNIELDGERALHYVRMRQQDPRGDLGRNARQQQVMEAIMEEALSIQSVFQAGNIIDILGENVSTNMAFDEMQTVFEDYRSAVDNIETIELEGIDEYRNNSYYYIVEDREQQRARLKLERHQDRSE